MRPELKRISAQNNSEKIMPSEETIQKTVINPDLPAQQTTKSLTIDQETLRLAWQRSLGGTPLEELDPDLTQGHPNDPEDLSNLEDAPYEIGEELGRGGMGVVYKAQQHRLQRHVAVKMLKKEAEQRSGRQDFLSEAYITAALDHPNIVPVYDLWAEQDKVALSMKIIEGDCWRDKLRQRSKDEYGAVEDLQVLLAVCNAVAYAHSKKLIHCDLKPENIMLGQFGEVLVLDWGVAVSTDSLASSKTGIRKARDVSAPFGTPSYMSPELAEGRGEDIGPQTDVYLLGSILCEIISGQSPHQGSSIIKVLLCASLSKAKSFHSSVPSELAMICNKALALKIADRYQSVLDFKSALSDYLNHRESTLIATMAQQNQQECQRARELPLNQIQRNTIYFFCLESIAGFRQALTLWPGNNQARIGEQSARREYAETALRFGDIGLAESQLEQLTDQDIQSELSRSIEIGRRQQGRTERAARALKWTLALSLITAAIGVFVYVRDIEEQRLQTARQAQIAKAEAKRADEQAELARQEAKRASDRVAIVDSSLKALVYEVKTELGDMPWGQAKDARRKLLQVARKGRIQLKESYQSEKKLGWEYGVTLVELGSIWETEGQLAQALDSYQEALKVFRRHPQGKQRSLARELQPCHLLMSISRVHKLLGQIKESKLIMNQAKKLTSQILKAHPENVKVKAVYAAVLAQGGHDDMNLGNVSTAWKAFEEGLKVLESFSHDRRTNIETLSALASLYSVLADIEGKHGGPKRAIELSDKSLALSRRIFKTRPASTRFKVMMIVSLSNSLSLNTFVESGKAKIEKLEALSVEGLSLCTDLTSADPSNTHFQNLKASLHLRVAQIALQRKQLQKAEENFEIAMATSNRLLAMDSSNSKTLRNAGKSYGGLAVIYAQQQKKAAALAAHNKSIAIFRGLKKHDPNNIQAQLDFLLAVFRLGNYQGSLGHLKQALQSFTESNSAMDQFTKAHPSSIRLKKRLLRGLVSETMVRQRLLDPEGSLEALERAVELAATLSTQKYVELLDLTVFMFTFYQCGNLSLDLKKPHSTVEHFESSLSLAKRIVQKDPSNGDAISLQEIALQQLAELKDTLGDPKGAVQCYERVLKLLDDPKRPSKNAKDPSFLFPIHFNRGLACEKLKIWKKALESFQIAVDLLESKDPEKSKDRGSLRILAGAYTKLFQTQQKLGLHKDSIKTGLKLMAIHEQLKKLK
jgi:serine/threonine protein kinase